LGSVGRGAGVEREDGKVEIAVGREDQAVGNHGIELFAEDGRIAVEGGSELGERLGAVGGVEGEEGGPAFVRKWEIAGHGIGEGPGAGVRIEGEGERLFKEHGIDNAQSGTLVAIVGGLLVEKEKRGRRSDETVDARESIEGVRLVGAANLMKQNEGELVSRRKGKQAADEGVGIDG